MNFPLPDVKEEDRGLLRELRARRKYEPRKPKKSSRTFKSDTNRDSSSSCFVTVTVIFGAVVVILTVIFTAMEIVHNRNTQITAYPIDPNSAAQSTANSKSIIKPPPYEGPSMEVIKEELQRTREHQQSQQNQYQQTAQTPVGPAPPKEIKANEPKYQWDLIPTDFPPGWDLNSMSDLIGSLFENTEFYRRFKTQGNTQWFDRISQTKAIYNESLYKQLPICVQLKNTANGYGFRVWRDAQVYYHSALMSCTLKIEKRASP